MIAFINCNSNLVPLLDGLCSSNPCRFEFSIFSVFAGLLSSSRLVVWNENLRGSQLFHGLRLVVLLQYKWTGSAGQRSVHCSTLLHLI